MLVLAPITATGLLASGVGAADRGDERVGAGHAAAGFVLVGLIKRLDCFEAVEGDQLGAGRQFVGCRAEQASVVRVAAQRSDDAEHSHYLVLVVDQRELEGDRDRDIWAEHEAALG
jgi:hypothetical protein